jgi:hypothetical protein
MIINGYLTHRQAIQTYEEEGGSPAVKKE